MFVANIVVMSLSFSPGSLSTRRDLLAQFVAGAAAAAPLAAHAVSARTGTSSVFTGEYDDPNHPGCLRSVKVVGPKVDPAGRKGRNPVAYVKGVDTTVPGKYMCDRVPELSEVWKLEGKVSEDGESISIDFSPKTKGEVGMLIGKWDTFGSPGITFRPPDARRARVRLRPMTQGSRSPMARLLAGRKPSPSTRIETWRWMTLLIYSNACLCPGSPGCLFYRTGVRECVAVSSH